GTVIGSHVVLKGPTTIGRGNRIFLFAAVGEDCQDKKYKDEPSRLISGDNEVIGGGCPLHRAAVHHQGVPRIGTNNLLTDYEPTRLIIGDNNVIREGCTLHSGTVQDQGVTRIGSNNLLMAYVHIAHDCVVGDNIIMANNATIAGHVHVGDGAILGGYTTVHQF